MVCKLQTNGAPWVTKKLQDQSLQMQQPRNNAMIIIANAMAAMFNFSTHLFFFCMDFKNHLALEGVQSLYRM